MSTDITKTPDDMNPEDVKALLAPAGQKDLWLDTERFEHIWRIANCFATSGLVPKHLDQNPEACFIIFQLASRLDIDPFMLMSRSYAVQGKPGIEAKVQIAILNKSGRIRGPLQFTLDGEGDDYGCVAWAIDAETGEKVVGPKVDLRMVKKEGWYEKNGSKWKTMPGPMYRYRSASFFINIYYPEVTLGISTREELEDVVDVESHAVRRPSASGGALPGLLKAPEPETEPEPEGTTSNDFLDAQSQIAQASSIEELEIVGGAIAMMVKEELINQEDRATLLTQYAERDGILHAKSTAPPPATQKSLLDDPPLTSAELKASYREQINLKRSVERLDSLWDKIQADPDLDQDHHEILEAEVRSKREQLNG